MLHRITLFMATGVFAGVSVASLLMDGVQAQTFDRSILPIREPAPPVYKELDARNAKAPVRWDVKAPEGAPNVVVVLIDDIGFGHSSAFGGPCLMPNLEKLANNG
ncbi:MAG: sulfatase-like hydrolase/transferase [Planctomycetota bacterium]|nr:sulfatase-like hydrolase/transferase [Planctomycetota bacterium]